MFIKDFVVGEEITGFYLIKSMNVKTSSSNKPYLDMTLTDITGEVNAKIWDVKGDPLKQYNAGDIVKVKASVTSWQQSNQLKIIKVRKINDEDQVDYSQFVPSAPIESETMYNEILFAVNKMEDADIKKLTLAILDKNKEKLLYYPAAKSNHHSIKSGLLYHIVRMLRTAEALSSIYTNVNRDLLVAGIILHDMEKINEMRANELGIVDTYTKEGQLLGHIIMGIKVIDALAKELKISEEKSLLIQHMILAHHYEPEFGSPKKPMIPEGELLHYIDMIDARMYDMEKVVSGIEPENFSEPVFVLDRRRLYNPKL